MALLNKSKGFTLLELIVVILILSISLSLIIPRITNNDKQYIKSTKNKILILLKTARYKSIFLRKKINVYVKKNQIYFNIKDNKIKFKDKNLNIKLKEPEYGYITFYPTGAVSPFVLIVQKNNYTLEISFDSVKSRFKVEINNVK